MALADTQHPHYITVAGADLDDSVNDHLRGPVMAADIEATGSHRRQSPLSPSDLPYPRAELRTWSECLMPAGIHEALGVALFEPGGRHVGHLALFYGNKAPPSPDIRTGLSDATSVIGRGMDPLQTLISAARLVRGAASGAVLLVDGTVDVLPGLAMDPLLREGSTVLQQAHAHIHADDTYTSFLWPTQHEGSTHLQVTVIAATATTPTMHQGVVVLSPSTELRGLTPRELEVLGYVVDGCSNQEISHRLGVAPRTVAAHVEHILFKLDAPSRTIAAVRACREGLYVPVSASRGVPSGSRAPAFV
jgi:DNA-binding CsgD family transcriptional regulator